MKHPAHDWDPGQLLPCRGRLPVVRSVLATGLEVAYERAGSGPLMVFVHGAAEDGRVWERQLAALADEFTVVAWDEPGAGRSADVPDGFTLGDYADCLAALIESIGLGPAQVAGCSWGGTLALELYRRHPERVASLILADTYAGWKGSLSADEVRSRDIGLRALLATHPFDPVLPGLFAGEPPAESVALLQAMAADVRPDSMRLALSLMVEADLHDVLPTIAVPTLLVWGELDARSPTSIARTFQRAIPAAKLVVIAGAGHASHLERPGEFEDAVRDFCRGVGRGLQAGSPRTTPAVSSRVRRRRSR